MKYLLIISLIFLASCDKEETIIPPPVVPKVTVCDVSAQSGFSTDPNVLVTYGAGFVKQYSDGKVTSLIMSTYAQGSSYYAIDSFFYDFTYESNIAHVTGQVKHYERGGADELVLGSQSADNFDVVFNDSGFASQAGDLVFSYDGNKLMSGGTIDFTYDDHGNITKVKKGNVELQYTYDLNTTAKNQLYITSGGWIDNRYNFLEVMGWIPVQPKNLRISHSIVEWVQFDTDLFEQVLENLLFTDHVITDGSLVSFTAQNDTGDGLVRSISNVVTCTTH